MPLVGHATYLGTGPGPRVLDPCAGTGKLTATLVALGAEVIAVEPGPATLAELRRTLPAVRAPPGSAEADFEYETGRLPRRRGRPAVLVCR